MINEYRVYYSLANRDDSAIADSASMIIKATSADAAELACVDLLISNQVWGPETQILVNDAAVKAVQV